MTFPTHPKTFLMTKNPCGSLFYVLSEGDKMLYVSGPGCSSVGYGATQEIGPFIVDTDGHGLKYNPSSWNTGWSTKYIH